MSERGCSILLTEPAGIFREKEPLRLGVPFAKSAVFDETELRVVDKSGSLLPFQAKVLERWPNRSLKWVLVESMVDLEAGAQEQIFVDVRSEEEASSIPERGLTLVEEGDRLTVDTGKAVFILSCSDQLIDAVEYESRPLHLANTPQINLLDQAGERFSIKQPELQVEEKGPISCTLLKKVKLSGSRSGRQCNLTIRYRFYAGSGLVRMDVLLHNPAAARHLGGLWDLGDKGSVFFQDFTLRFGLHTPCTGIGYKIEQEGPVSFEELGSLLLHQNSSGRKNWNSPNHIDKDGEKTVSLAGYRFTAETVDGDMTQIEGRAASPWICMETASSRLAVAVDKFWQNFPKSLRVEQNQLDVGLFPHEQERLFELQGGEQKRHTVWFEFGSNAEKSTIEQVLKPLQYHIDPSWIEHTGAVSAFTAQETVQLKKHNEYINNIIKGHHSFFEKRDVIDEYGWRNYGDIYADHEAVKHTGPDPFISHYNNQYDFIYGAFLQFLRSGDRRWWRLATPAAHHMIDIDIYRTREDKAAYNGGLFWHTDHYQPANTATHRAYSRSNKSDGPYGGGTSNEHIYTSGLCLYYYLTGDVEAKEAVITLADYVVAMDDGKRSLFCLFSEGATGLASQTVESGYHHPGRGAGNSINCLIDAYRLSGDRSYFEKAEELIRRCIHPADEVADLDLDEPECRWSYLVFLQVLGKYLSYKLELGEQDYVYYYARDSLLTYAHWMSEHEVPYNDVLDKVLIPTETWPAQDIRKAHVFFLAAAYVQQDLRQRYRDKATFFLERSLEDVLLYDTAFLARPLVLHCVYGTAVSYYMQVNPVVAYAYHNYHFGLPAQFIPQRQAFKDDFILKLKTTWSAIRNILSAKYSFMK